MPAWVQVKVIQNYTLILNFIERKNYRHSKNILIYKAKQFMMTKAIPRKVHIF